MVRGNCGETLRRAGTREALHRCGPWTSAQTTFPPVRAGPAQLRAHLPGPARVDAHL